MVTIQSALPIDRASLLFLVQSKCFILLYMILVCIYVGYILLFQSAHTLGPVSQPTLSTWLFSTWQSTYEERPLRLVCS